MDPELIGQAAIDPEHKTVEDAYNTHNVAVEELNRTLAQNPSNANVPFLQKRVEDARGRIGSAENELTSTLTRISTASRLKAQQASSPAQQRNWAAHADQAE